MIRARLLGGREGTLGSVAARLLCLRCPVGFCGCCHRRAWQNSCSAWHYVPIISMELLAGGSRNRTQCLCCSLLNGPLFYCHRTGFSAIKMPRKWTAQYFLQCVQCDTVLDVITCEVWAWKFWLCLFPDGKFLVLVTKKKTCRTRSSNMLSLPLA